MDFFPSSARVLPLDPLNPFDYRATINVLLHYTYNLGSHGFPLLVALGWVGPLARAPPRLGVLSSSGI